MKFFKYGIILERLKEEDIELVRQWRNSDPVRLNMKYQDLITPEQQLKWFHSINNLQVNYLMIHYEGVKIGLLNDKNIDWVLKSSESGLFFGRTEFYNTFVPYLVSVAGIETTFNFLGWNKQVAHIMKSNTNAIQFNLQLGYQLCEGQEHTDHQRYELTWEQFLQKAGKIRNAVRSVAGNDSRTKILFEPADYEIGLAQRYEELLKAYSGPIEREESHEGIWYLEAVTDKTDQI
jgi:RimJ/RimL family protein N-acetyltransferase